MILLASELEGGADTHLALMPITVQRNAFGRQLGSFSSLGMFEGIGEIPMTFIRAPVILKADKNVHKLAEYDGFSVAARYDTMLVTAFHPELTNDTRVLQYFLGMDRLQTLMVDHRGGRLHGTCNDGVVLAYCSCFHRS